MEVITQWFNDGCPFTEGVAIYKALPKTSSKVLRSLKRGKSSYNKSLLIKELRAFKTKPIVIEPPKKQQPKPKTQPRIPVTDAIIAKEQHQTQAKTEALKIEYGSVKYAHLPPELKPRYRELGNIFYQMCDLKFILNDIPPKAEKEALAIILQIEELDDQRTLIWREIDHWNAHKSILPTEADDYKGLNSDELRTAKARIASNITKLEQRIDAKYVTLFETTDLKSKIKLENTIRRSEATLHQHKLNVSKINELL